MQIHRDDMLEGGTKRRALDLLISSSAETDYFYAGTVMGHGALALARACADYGRNAHIFLSAAPDIPMVEKIRSAGARLYLHPPLPIAKLHAMAVGAAGGRMVFPPGFATPSFEAALAGSMATLTIPPCSEIWVASVTGTLSRALKKAFARKKIMTVSVVKNGEGNFTAPEKYHQMARTPPPYPSCPYTDAKVWQFAQTHAADDALIWNTAG